MAVIKIPKTPKRAFDKSRPASNLVQAQIEHLEAAATGIYPAKRRRRKPRTEAQAAAYIEKLTRQLHPQAATPPVTADATPKPATEPSRARRPTRTPPRTRKQKAKRQKAR